VEAGIEHPRARGVTRDSRPRRLVGIDLGTTNSAVAWVDSAHDESQALPKLFEVPQLVAAGEIGSRLTLPSFLYIPTKEERESGTVSLPWDSRPDAVAGVFARDHGALIPMRQVSSAKSWLSNPSVDRRARLLPFGSDEAPRLSPVEASARLLAHLRDAWNTGHGDTGPLFQELEIVLAVPASFDEEARELTVEAARDAGLTTLTLLEEPLAAVYAWIASHSGGLRDSLTPGQLLLVCDVGGGTTDFTLIRAISKEIEIRFERTAIGEHLLLGGDNVDLALAALLERKLVDAAPGAARLGLTQRLALRRQAGSAKERLLSAASPDRVNVTVLGTGRSVVGGTMTTSLTRDEVLGVLNEFLPITAADERPRRQVRHALRELGLPYENDPAITRHLAAFLERAARMSGSEEHPGTGTSMVSPDAVLFNGGFFTPAVARDRILDALASWSGRRPTVLTNDAPEAAVAIGAAFYGALRRVAHDASWPLIRAGSARTYYIGVHTGDSSGATTAVCVMPRGTQEGARVELDREFTVITNQPAAFTLFSSVERADPLNALVKFAADDEDEVHQHAPLVTALRYGQRTRKVPLAVRLVVMFTEVGTLELWCASRTTEHRWRLQFNLRETARDESQTRAVSSSPHTPAATNEPAAASASSRAPKPTESESTARTEIVIPDSAVATAEELLRAVFGSRSGGRGPDALIGDIENALGHGKHSWPLPTIRRLADVLLQLADGRRTSARHEARWLNLTGFCMRPGFGTSLDPWRITEARKVYAAGLAYPKDIQCQVEWLILWQRVSAGFTASQQQELASKLIGTLGLGARKAPRLNPQLLRESWRLLGGLERLDQAQRSKLGDEMVARVRREPHNASFAWAIGRFGARTPLYGPLNAVVRPQIAERWLEVLLAIKTLNADLAAAIAEIGARTDDPARDISDAARDAALARLAAAGTSVDVMRPLREHVALDRVTGARIFGETLPEGLRIE
jgi:DNA-K related protein/Hsp70 protein